MSDELTRKSAGMDRRSFLRGSTLLVAAAGLARCAPSVARPQASPNQADSQPSQQQPQQPAQPAQPAQAQQPAQTQEQPAQAQQQPAQAPQQAQEQTTEQKLYDSSGREYRICPQCGANMYKEGRTWTCEACGYSYVE